jgi:hypothetical protein
MKRSGHTYKITYDHVIDSYGEVSRELRQYGLKRLKLDRSEQVITKLKEHLFEPFFNKALFSTDSVGCDYAFGVSKLFLKDHSYDQLERLLKGHRIHQTQKAVKIV